MAERVSDEAINRSYLARQLLLERSEMPVGEAIEHLVGLQAQDVLPPYVTLWTRLRAFAPDDLAVLLERREAVRLTLMRGTVHLVSNRDALRFWPIVQPEVRKAVIGRGSGQAATSGFDPDRLVDFAMRTMVEGGSGMPEMTEAAKYEWPDGDAQLLARAAIYLVPATQVPPRGLWKRHDRPRWAMLDAWLGAPCIDDYPVDEMILRYLRAFGPASITDFQTWSRLTGLRPIFERLRPVLRVLEDERGRELVDVPDAPWPDPEIPAPVRFLGAFDNLLLAHKNRERIIDPTHWTHVMTSNGIGKPSILIDGRVSARYRVEAKKGIARMTIEPFQELEREVIIELEAEGARLLQFLEPGNDHEIVYENSLC